MANETYTQSLYDDLTLPLGLLRGQMESVMDANTDRDTCACIGEVLIQNAEKNYRQLVDALEAKFGHIEIEHEKENGHLIYHWGKVIGVSSEK